MTAPNAGDSTPKNPTLPAAPVSSIPPTWTAPDGRTADQVLADLTTTKQEATLLRDQNAKLYQIAERFNQAPPAPTPAQIADDDYLTGAQVKQYVAQAVGHAQSQFQPTINSQAEQLAQASLGIVQQQRAADFKRFGAEIMQEVAKVPSTHRTLDNLNLVVDLIRGRHVDDLARERAAEIAATEPPAMRATGTSSAGAVIHDQSLTLDSELIPESWRQLAKQQNIDERTLDEFCRVNYPELSLNDARQKFLDQFKSYKGPNAQVHTRGLIVESR